MDGASAAASTRGSAQTRAPLSSSPTSPRALPEAELHPILRLLAEGPSWGPRAAPRQQIARPASCPRRPRGLFRRPSARSIYLLLRGRYRDLHTVFYSVTRSKTSKNSWQSGQHFPQLCMAACSTPPGGPVPPPTSSHRYQPPLPATATGGRQGILPGGSRNLASCPDQALDRPGVWGIPELSTDMDLQVSSWRQRLTLRHPTAPRTPVTLSAPPL